MAISTVKITDTMEWAKRLSWNRNSGIGNALQPALSNANMIMQTILSPPFEWWWNNQYVSFTCSTTPTTSPITNVTIAAGIVTLATVNTWSQDQQVLVSGLTTVTQLNGQLLTILTASGTQVTAMVSLANVGSTADTGTLTNVTIQDYSVAIPNFSHIEHATLLDNTARGIAANPPSGKLWELSVKNNLSLDSNIGRPEFINPQTETSTGNVIFRVMPAPNANYPVSIQVQLTAPVLTSLNDTWGPIPDYFQYVYNWGFLALTWAFADDPRFQMANAKFTAALLSRAQGLTEEQRNIFLNNWNNITGQQQAATQQGMQARGV